MKTIFKTVFYSIAAIKNLLLLMGGLACLMASCDTQYIPDSPDEGHTAVSAKEGNFKLTIRIANYGEQADTLSSLHSMESKADTLPLTRSMEPETDVIRVNDDLFIYATLSVDTVERTPAVTMRKFTDNARIRVIGFREDPGPSYVQVFDEIYKVDNTGTLTRESSPDLIVLPVARYKLVAYSYNNTTTAPPAYSATISAIDPVNDLIWGVSDTVTVVNGIDNIIPITMVHKLSQIKLVATTGAGGPQITDFSGVTMPGYSVNLTTFTGAIAQNTAISQSFNFPTLNRDTVKADVRTVYTGTPGDMPTVVQIGSMTVNGQTVTDFSAAFAKSLKSGYSYTMTMKIGDNPNLTDNIPVNFLTYVGAFWKKDQTGERLIRMLRMTTGEIDSVWTAQVIEGKDWILLDKVMTTDPNVWNVANEASVENGNDPLFESNLDRQLTNSPTASTFVSGIVRASGSAGFRPGDDQIYFRIGLKDQYTPTTDKPARYGIVLLTYANNTRRHRIWIRQGEDPDYLMRPGNTNKTGATVANGRPNAVRFSPYNLTDPNRNSVNNYNNVPELGTNANNKGGVFVDYPSKAGYLFQWNVNTRAFHPTLQISNWGQTGATNTWIDAATETCPKGYRRPNDGNPTAGDINTSEMRQSLWINSVASSIPSDGAVANMLGNVVFGYYADGYFDRRQIVQGVTNPPALLTAVASPGAEVAYRGMLFYNQFNNASLFFPVTGYRENTGGVLTEAGKSGHAWTRTFNPGSSPMQMGFDPTGTGTSRMNILNTYQAATIRCVYDPNYVLPSAISITDPVSTAPISSLLFVSGPAANDPVTDPNGLAPRDGTRPASQQFKVTWQNPNNALAVIKTTPAGTNPFLALPGDWGNASYVSPSLNVTTLAAPSPKTFTVQPPAFTVAEITAAGGYPADKITEVKFVVTNGGKQDTASITLTHRYYHFSALPLSYAYTNSNGIQRDSWTLNGMQDTIQVKSNVRWRIKSIVGNGASVDGGVYNPLSSYTQLFQSIGDLQVGHEGGSNAGPTTENILMTTINARDIWGGITITFESPDGYFQDYTMSVIFALPETRIVGIDSGALPYGYAVRVDYTGSTITGTQSYMMLNNPVNFGVDRGISTVYSRGFTTNQNAAQTNFPSFDNTAPFGATSAGTITMPNALGQITADQFRRLMNYHKPHILILAWNWESSTPLAQPERTAIINIVLDFLDRGGVLFLWKEYDAVTGGASTDYGGGRLAAQAVLRAVFNDQTITTVQGHDTGSAYKLIERPDIPNDIITNGPFPYDNPNAGNPSYPFSTGKFWGNDANDALHVTGLNESMPGLRIYSTGERVGGATGIMTARNVGLSSFALTGQRNIFFLGDGGFVSSCSGTNYTICPFVLDNQQRPISKQFRAGGYYPNTPLESNRVDVNNSALFANMMLWGFSRINITYPGE